LHPDYRFTFTGHSLGGALAVHAAAGWILSDLLVSNKVYIYTYGQPRVGNKEFLDLFEHRVDEFYRVVHHKDIVSHMPPCMTDWHNSCHTSGILPIYPFHSAQEIWYEENFPSYTECNSTHGEDPLCSNSQKFMSVDNHLYYFGIQPGMFYFSKVGEITNDSI
jgi:hypothetical protein